MNRTKQTARKPFFYGWVIVGACLLLSATSTGLLSYFTALFVQPVTEALNVSRATFMVHSTIASVTTMFAYPIIGALFEKFSPKALILIGTCFGAGAHLCFSFSTNVFGFYIGAIFVGLGMCMFGGMPIAILLSNWFEEKRGFVTGIAFTGSAIVSSLFSPVISWIIQSYGWRLAYRTIGTSIFILVVPTVLFLIRVKPSDMGLKPYGSHEKREVENFSAPVGFTRNEALKMPAFWLFAFAIFALGIITPGTQQHLVAYWSECGASATSAAQMYSVVMLCSMFGKIGVGGIYDRFSVKNASLICFLIAVAAMISLIVFNQGISVLIPAVLFGITTSLEVMASTYLTSKFFGELAYGALYGLINTVLFLGVSIGVSFSALIYDITGGYFLCWGLYAVIALVAMVCVLTANQSSKKAFRDQLHIERKE